MKKDYIKPTAEVILLDLEDVRMKIAQGSGVIEDGEVGPHVDNQ